MRRSYLLKTLGCKANFADGQRIESELQKRGWVPVDEASGEVADLCIVNSCTVTDEADRQSRKSATRLSREHPGGRVVFTGCGAEVDPKGLLETRGIDLVVGNRDKSRLVDLVLEAAGAPEEAPRILGSAENYPQMLSRHPIDREWPAVESTLDPGVAALQGSSRRTRAFLKIQDGCNSFCTYCVIPYGRGPSRSLEIPKVVEQVRALVEEGVREVVITGINIGDYGVDWNSGRPALTELFEAILAQTPLERLRVSSLDPVEIDHSLMALMRREPRFCPHFHVSLQSPESRVLKLMKRKYSTSDVEKCLAAVARVPADVGGVFVGMDVISGFPGEGEEEFNRSLELLTALPWTRLHVFPYSERAGTPATRLPGAVPPEERSRRAKALRELSLSRMRAHHQGVLEDCARSGACLEGVLVESRVKGPDGSDQWWSGYTRNYLKVLFRSSDENLGNQVVRVRPLSLVVDSKAGDCAFMGELKPRESPDCC